MRRTGSKAMRPAVRAGVALLLALVMTAAPVADIPALHTVGADAVKLGTVRAAAISVTEHGGYNEGAYAEWAPVDGANGYEVSVSKDQQTWTALDDELIRQYESCYRADALGLTEGVWYLRIEAGVYDGAGQKVSGVGEEIVSAEVTKHDRSGFAFVDGTASGAYNDDGSLRDNANVVYVTNENKDRVALKVITGDDGATTDCVGLQGILNGYRTGRETRPLCVRIIGNIDDPAVLTNGDMVLQNARNAAAGITIEGVGEDAVINGWGIQVESASNVEIRNLAAMNCDSGEGDNFSLVKDNDHVWIHNCDSFYGEAGTDDDQKKGDGAMDCKKSTYITFSYNHFWDNGKSCLLGLEEGDSYDGRITYHHNWFDHSDSRHPRVRYYTAHVYNNYYDGIAKYGIGSTLGSSIFAESNYFRNCKKPMLISMQGTDIAGGGGTFSKESGGVIKAYGNILGDNASFVPYGSGDGEDKAEFDAYVAQSREERVPDTVVSNRNGGEFSDQFVSERHTYNNFDTAEDFYHYTADAAEDVPAVVTAEAGRLNGGDFQFEFDDAVDDASYNLNQTLKDKLHAYTSGVVTVGGIAANPTVPFYELTFLPENGEASWVEKVIIGETIAEPEAPGNPPEGKVSFDGWFYQDKKCDFSQPVKEDMTFIGKWLAQYEKPTVYGAIPIGTQAVEYQIVTSEDTPANVKNTPYFNVVGDHKRENGRSGAHKDAEGNEKSYYGRYRLVGDSKMSVTFSTTRAAELVLFLDGNKKLSVDGKSFTAGANGENGIIVTTVAAGAHEIKAVSGSSAYLYAIWVIPEVTDYSVTVDLNDGSAPAVTRVAKGEAITDAILPELPVREDYDFVAWVDGSGKELTIPFSIILEDDMYIRAIWQKKTYHITVDLDGGAAGDFQNPIIVESGKQITLDMLPVPVKNGYIFEGWVYEDGSPITWPVTVTGNLTFKASWRRESTGDGEDPGPVKPDPGAALEVVLKDTEPEQYIYTGSAVKPEIDVYNYGRKLTLGVDYTVKYSNNVKASQKLKADGTYEDSVAEKKKPRITVTGKGSLSGSVSQTFDIRPKDISDEDVAAGDVIIANKGKVTPVLYYGSVKLGKKDFDWTDDCKIAAAGKQEVLDSDFDENGEKIFTYKVKGIGNYTGEKDITVVVKKDKRAIKKLYVEISKSYKPVFNSYEQKPVLGTDIFVKETNKNGTDLSTRDGADACFDVTYSADVINAGTVKVTVIGKNGYTGAVTKSYKISPVSSKTICGTIEVDRSQVNTDGYTFRSAGVTINDDLSVVYNYKKDADSSVESILLKENKDYKITYSNNKKVSAASKPAKYTINFLGNYKGSKAIKDGNEFKINAAPLDDTTAKVIVPDKVYTGKAGTYVSKPYVTIDGVALKTSDYQVTYYKDEALSEEIKGRNNNIEFAANDPDTEKTVYVKVVGRNNYAPASGAAQEEAFAVGEYKVCRKSEGKLDLSKAKVTVTSRTEYSGKELEPEVSVTYKKNGVDTTLKEGEDHDYTVTYVNNVRKGKGTVIITAAKHSGCEYVGSKTKTFSIVAWKLTGLSDLLKDLFRRQ